MTKGLFPGDITRTTLAVLFIAILIAVCFWILKPFLSALIWATMIVIATWPLMTSIQGRLGGRRSLAVLVMTLLLLVILIAPLTLAIVAIVDKAQELIANNQTVASFRIPPPPAWLATLPFAGAKLAERWQEYASLDQRAVAELLTPYAKKFTGWFLVQAGSVGMVIVHCFLTVIVSAVLYARGEIAAEGVRRFVRRIAGQSGEEAALLAARAVRGVAIGIVGTALVQSLLGGIALFIAGVPALPVLTAVIFFLCAAQIGPVPVLVPATIWLFLNDQTNWAIFMLVWTVIVSTIDNFIRPILIRRGADLPLLLIFAGVIGGLLSFGMIGLFVGPVMLAVTYTLLKEWVVAGEKAAGQESVGG